MGSLSVTLGTFGDERLEKRGACSFRRWRRGAASAFAAWQAVSGVGLSDFRVFWQIRG